MSKLWLISQDENDGWGTYDSAVVVADNEAQAKDISPDGRWSERFSSWAKRGSPSIKAKYVGEAAPTLEPGEIIYSSFNAG